MLTPDARPIHVAKFGGTSVATAERIQQVVQLIQAAPAEARHIVVVSALGGVTDRLLQAIEEALARSGEHPDILDELRQRHEAVLQAVAEPDEHAALREHLEARFGELGELLDGISLLRECTLRSRDAIIGMGERLSAPLVAAAFRAAGTPATAHEAHRFIRTDDAFGEANVLFGPTYGLVRRYFGEQPGDEVAIVTGFIASTDRSVLTTLGRSGSDYTATLLAAALDAEQVVIWTDVDGVLSADPRLVPDAFPLPQLHYREAGELAYFGAKVLHPRTMRPLQEQSIPLFIKNTLNPTAAGTLIAGESTESEGHVKAVTAIRDVAMVLIEGAGMVGVPGISARAFGALAQHTINVLLISQASSEQSICIVVRAAEAPLAVRALREAFALELERGDVSRVHEVPQCAIVSVVGDYMRDRPGLAGRMFSTLGQIGVNVRAIAEGAADTNISAVVRDQEAPQALQALHEAFALGRDRAHVFLIGPGLIGTTLLRLMAEQAPALLDALNLNLRLVGLANRERLVWDVEGIPFADALDRLDASDHPGDLDALVEHLVDSRLERLIVIDATASDEVAGTYERLLSHRIAVVTPNKRANSAALDTYRTLRRTARRQQVAYLYETTVGAGLPVISTVRDLMRSGDEVVRVDGVLSGTLAYVFNQIAAGRSFSEAVLEAKDLGYTEPDPRDDLGGEDVARKLLIVAREIGLAVERADVEVETLVPEALAEASVDDFLDGLAAYDDAWRQRVAKADAEGRRLAYAGQIVDGRLRVRVVAAEADHPLHGLRGTDNLFVFRTQRYSERPLVIQGPGAGPAVTAAGVLADVVHAATLAR